MYNSPISLFYNYDSYFKQIAEKIDEHTGNAVCEAVVECGVNVDKEQLLKALAYDRHQYEQGYRDGLEEGYRRAIEDCKNKLTSAVDTLLDNSGEV